MLVLILMLLLAVVVIGAFILSAGSFATGAGVVAARKLRERRINASLPPGVRMTKETPQEKEAREARRSYIASLVDREESPDEKEERERKEKREARKTHLDTLVDR